MSPLQRVIMPPLQRVMEEEQARRRQAKQVTALCARPSRGQRVRANESNLNLNLERLGASGLAVPTLSDTKLSHGENPEKHSKFSQTLNLTLNLTLTLTLTLPLSRIHSSVDRDLPEVLRANTASHR